MRISRVFGDTIETRVESLLVVNRYEPRQLTWKIEPVL